MEHSGCIADRHYYGSELTIDQCRHESDKQSRILSENCNGLLLISAKGPHDVFANFVISEWRTIAIMIMRSLGQQLLGLVRSSEVSEVSSTCLLSNRQDSLACLLRYHNHSTTNPDSHHDPAASTFFLSTS